MDIAFTREDYERFTYQLGHAYVDRQMNYGLLSATRFRKAGAVLAKVANVGLKAVGMFYPEARPITNVLGKVTKRL